MLGYHLSVDMKIPAFNVMPNLYRVVKHANTLLLHKPLIDFCQLLFGK